MGLMRCVRLNCESIGCCRYSKEYGYICDDCFDELVSSNKPIQIFLDEPKPNIELREKIMETVFIKENVDV